jgi:hypothetical protein
LLLLVDYSHTICPAGFYELYENNRDVSEEYETKEIREYINQQKVVR